MLYQNMVTGGIVSLLLLSAACTNPSGNDNPPPQKTYGSFRVTLVATDGYTAILGSMTDGPDPSGVVWDEIDAVGTCKLFKPRIPFCEPSCGGSGICVENDICQAPPTPISAGTVTVSGIKKSDGAMTFTINPMNFSYQPVGIAYPPFAEGDVVTFTAAGSSSAPPFTLTTKGIVPLAVLNDTIVMADGQPINLLWTPPGAPGNSTISVYIDISHHGGARGKIECETDDDGSLEIPAGLLDKLKTLGISGFPKIEVTRKAVGASPVTNVELILESKVTKSLEIPGLVSCWGDSEDECPDGQSCSQDKLCR